MEKIKVWVVYDEEYPNGLVYQDIDVALESSKESRDCGFKPRVRIKYYSKKELEAIPETD